MIYSCNFTLKYSITNISKAFNFFTPAEQNVWANDTFSKILWSLGATEEYWSSTAIGREQDGSPTNIQATDHWSFFTCVVCLTRLWFNPGCLEIHYSLEVQVNLHEWLWWVCVLQTKHSLSITNTAAWIIWRFTSCHFYFDKQQLTRISMNCRGRKTKCALTTHTSSITIIDK